MNPLLQDWTPPARPAQRRPPGATVTRLRLAGEITVENAIPLFHAIEAAGDDSIEITIDSGGGNALCALALYELLATHPHRVVAMIDRASSGAAEVAMGADHRIVTPGARIMLHEARADLKNAPADVLRETLADLARLDEIAIEILAAATGQTRERVTGWMRSAVALSSHQAVTVGLAHEIVRID